MQTTSRVAFLLASTALVAALTAEARAQQATINVSAFVEEGCSISTDPIDIEFGTYEDLQITKTSEFGWDCPAGKQVTFALTGDTPNALGSRNLPNTTETGTTPLEYFINDPLGGPWVGDFTVTSAGGPETETFEAILIADQLADVSPGNFVQSLTLSMSVQ